MGTPTAAEQAPGGRVSTVFPRDAWESRHPTHSSNPLSAGWPADRLLSSLAKQAHLVKVSTISSWRQGSWSHPMRGMSPLLHDLAVVPLKTINPGIILPRSVWLLSRTSFHYKSLFTGCEWVCLCPQGGGQYSKEVVLPPNLSQWLKQWQWFPIHKSLGDVIKLDHNLILNPMYLVLFLLLFMIHKNLWISFNSILRHGESLPFSPKFMNQFGRGLMDIFTGHTVVSYPVSHCVPMIDLFKYLNFTLYSFFE